LGIRHDTVVAVGDRGQEIYPASPSGRNVAALPTQTFVQQARPTFAAESLLARASAAPGAPDTAAVRHLTETKRFGDPLATYLARAHPNLCSHLRASSALGKRTRYQAEHKSQLVLLAGSVSTEVRRAELDAKALAAIVGAATVTAPGTVPANVDKGMAAIVDGALGVIETENRPSFALVSPDLYRSILLTNDDDKLAFLNAGFGLEEGDFASFKIVPANIGTGKVIVGAREAVKFFTLPGQPIRVEGLDAHHGGVDLAVFAYWASIAENANAVRSVTVAGA
jgi:hypothetical protein